MSLDYERAVLMQSKSKGASRLVLMILAFHANKDGECWPLVETIAQEMNGSTPAVNRAIAKLKELGEIETIKRGRARSSLYKILITPQEKPIESDRLTDEKPIESDIPESTTPIESDRSKPNNLSLLNEKPIESDRQNYKELPLKEELKTTTSGDGSFDLDFKDCLSLYQNNIGNLSQLQIDDFGDIFGGLTPPPMETKYEWFQYAILEATSNGVNNWKYCKAILERVNRAGSLAQHKGDRDNGNGSTNEARPTKESPSGAKNGPPAGRSHQAVTEYSRVNDANIADFHAKMFG